MTMRRALLFFLVSGFCWEHAFAQPVVVEPIPSMTLTFSGTNIDLSRHFNLGHTEPNGIRVSTPFGSFFLDLLTADAPRTVANFLAYVDDGSYSNVMVHRSAPGFVIQTGGFSAAIPPIAVTSKGTISNEFRLSNTRGTVAMARVGGQTNSATSQWFVNLTNNTGLDAVDGGFTVFARVRGNGMSVIDQIAALPVITNFNAPFNELPLRDLLPTQTSVFASNLVPFQSVERFPFRVRSSDPLAWSASLSTSNNILTILPGSRYTKAATITVVGADPQGRSVRTSFVVQSVPPRAFAGLVETAAGRFLFSLAVTASGSFSGTALGSAGGTSRLRGQLDRNGSSSQTVSIPGAGSVAMRYAPDADTVNVVTSAGTFQLRAAAWQTGSISPLSGKLANVLLSGGGDGFVQLRFDSLGTARISGRLADSSKFTGSLRTVFGSAVDTPLLPFLAAWKTGFSSSISGDIAIDAAAKTLAGSLSLKPRTAAARDVSVSGSFWTAPTSGTLPFRLRFESGGAVAGLPAQPVAGSWTPPGKPSLAAGSDTP